MDTLTRILLGLCTALLVSCNAPESESLSSPTPELTQPQIEAAPEPVSPPLARPPQAAVANDIPILERKARNEFEKKTRPKPKLSPRPEPEAEDAMAMVEPPPGLNEYKVTLSVDSQIKIPGPGGELRVWIGDPSQAPAVEADMTTSDVILPALGKTAKVTPFAPAFDIEPKTSMCMKIDPSGSIVKFNLLPMKEGKFKVSAEVQLFDSADCSGAAVPKTSSVLEVQVDVDEAVINKERKSQFLKVAWDKALEFWGTALTAIGAGILIIFRKQLSKRFGISARN